MYDIMYTFSRVISKAKVDTPAYYQQAQCRLFHTETYLTLLSRVLYQRYCTVSFEHGSRCSGPYPPVLIFETMRNAEKDEFVLHDTSLDTSLDTLVLGSFETRSGVRPVLSSAD